MTPEDYKVIAAFAVFVIGFAILGSLYLVLYRSPIAKLPRRTEGYVSRPRDKNALALETSDLVRDLIRLHRKLHRVTPDLQKFDVNLQRDLPACVLTSAIVLLNGYGWQFEKTRDGEMTVFPNTHARITSRVIYPNGPETYDPSVTQASVHIFRKEESST